MMQLANSIRDLSFMCQLPDSIEIMGTAFIIPSPRHRTVISLRSYLSAFGVNRVGNMCKRTLGLMSSTRLVE